MLCVILMFIIIIKGEYPVCISKKRCRCKWTWDFESLCNITRRHKNIYLSQFLIVVYICKNGKRASQDIIIIVDRENPPLWSYSLFAEFVEITDDLVPKNMTFGEKKFCHTKIQDYYILSFIHSSTCIWKQVSLDNIFCVKISLTVQFC